MTLPVRNLSGYHDIQTTYARTRGVIDGRGAAINGISHNGDFFDLKILIVCRKGASSVMIIIKVKP